MQREPDQPSDRSKLHFADPHGSSDDIPELDANVQGRLGLALQCHYDDLVGAPIPDRFLMLLAELEAKEARDG